MKVTVPPANGTGGALPERTIETTYSGDGLTTTVTEKNTAGTVISTNTVVTDPAGRTVTYRHTVPGSAAGAVLATIPTTSSYDTQGRPTQGVTIG